MSTLDKKTLDLIHAAYNESLEDDKQEESDGQEPEEELEKEEPEEFQKPHGVVETRNKDDILVQRSNYYNGVLHGETEVFEGDRLIQKCHYVQGQLEGEVHVFERGVCVAKISYVQGKKNGSMRLYKGDWLLVENYYSDNVLDGPSVHYHPNSAQCSVKTHYKEGLQEGLLLTYTVTGGLVREMGYVQGKKHGVSKTYYPTGELFEESSFIEDAQVGVMTQYYQNGVKKFERFFDVSGKAVREVIYDLSGGVLQETVQPAPIQE